MALEKFAAMVVLFGGINRQPPKYLLEVLSAATKCSKNPTTQRKYVFDQLYSLLKGRLPKGKLVYAYAFRAAVRKLFPSLEMGKYDDQHGSGTVTVQWLGEVMDELAEKNEGPTRKRAKKN